MIDLHMHVLWGLDDGAADGAEALAMLGAAARQGVKTIAATVHAYPGLRRFDREKYAARLGEAQALCRENGLDIALLPGAEIAATFQLSAALRSGAVPTLGNSDYALVELWREVSWKEAYTAVDDVLRAGYLPILAHVERYACFLWQPQRALRFRRETGALLQIDASALLRAQVFPHRRFFKQMLLDEGLDVVASDAHNMRNRPPDLGSVFPILEQRVGEAYARRLTGFEVDAR